MVWLNGKFVDDAEASLPLRDPGLLHGAGVFTTMQAIAGNVFRLEQHSQRIRDSSQLLSIPFTFTDQALVAVVKELLEKNNLSEARLRLTVTAENCFLTATKFHPYPQELYEKGMTAALLDDQKLNPWDTQAGHKTLNYMSRIAALRSAQHMSCGEALWFNIYNYLQSGSISNVFLVKNGRLVTPPTQAEIDGDQNLRERLPYARSNVLPGITRQAILEIAGSQSVEVEFAAINVEQLLNADEVFLTNSIMNVMPVTRIERSVVGNDKPGEITLRFSQALNQMQH
ncbi:MAG TPA: aminotransferase class IV [Tepidisphaeraceae bacterium]|jgi:branched-chain amino acid aminotransferase